MIGAKWKNRQFLSIFFTFLMKNIIFSFLKWPRRQILFSKQIRLLTNKLAHKPVSGQHGQVLASEKWDRFVHEITCAVISWTNPSPFKNANLALRKFWLIRILALRKFYWFLEKKNGQLWPRFFSFSYLNLSYGWFQMKK